MQQIRFFSIVKYLINTEKLNLMTTGKRKLNLVITKTGKLKNFDWTFSPASVDIQNNKNSL